jgi:hypothetical protein
MSIVLCLLLVAAALGQVYLGDFYKLMAVSKGEMMTVANFLKEAQRGLRAFGIAMLFSYLGIWAITLNILLFFKRLGTQITAYLVFWWAVLTFGKIKIQIVDEASKAGLPSA